MNKTRQNRILCLVNTASGNGKGGQLVQALRELSSSKKSKYDIVLGELPGNLPSLEEMEQNYSDVLIAGGDGTNSSILARYVNANVCFHFLPLGTANDLARELGVYRLWTGNVEDFLAQSFCLPSQYLSIWRLRVEQASGEVSVFSFVNYFSLGLDAAAVAQFHAQRALGHFLCGRFGPWGNRILYGYWALRLARHHLPEIELQISDEVTRVFEGLASFLVSNINSIMGMGEIHRCANATDETLELSPIFSPLQYLKMLWPHALRTSRVAIVQARNFQLRFPISGRATHLQIDGEPHQVTPRVLAVEPLGKVLVRGKQKADT